ncbi:MAG: LD-carboxypeptidase [Paludibacteraceae bacterium]|nr:LD-carboxypeptidase [Paludibacteraceae bacterium]MBP3716987.1 LD-carboxypeptidase [Paludibacteraceae bacterium]MBR6103552.1 LD-carboxypeptidase [Paludibacteraceae bacterium]
MSNSLLPPALQQGDLVVILSPSSALADASLVDGAKRTLEGWGLRVRVANHALDSFNHFAGTDIDRCSDFEAAMNDPEVKCILCSRGGYGASRMIDNFRSVDVPNNPKWIIGFSDITALHAYVSVSGTCSLHAPMAKALANSHSQKRILKNMHDILFGLKGMDYKVAAHPMNRVGTGCGRLFGGNLSLIYSLQGTPFQFPADGAILFIEDLSEKVYHIDRMLMNLRLSGMLSRLNGLVVGQFTDLVPNTGIGQSLEEIVMSKVADYGYPVCFNFPVGHVGRNFPMVEGALVELSVSAEKVTLVQKEFYGK